eukprot:g20092.t1
MAPCATVYAFAAALLLLRGVDGTAAGILPLLYWHQFHQLQRAIAAPASSAALEGCFVETNVNYFKPDSNLAPIVEGETLKQCARRCTDHDQCVGVVYGKSHPGTPCYLKKVMEEEMRMPGESCRDSVKMFPGSDCRLR